MACCEDQNKKECQKPETLEGAPEDCSKEQIKECHGRQGDEHPCCCNK